MSHQSIKISLLLRIMKDKKIDFVWEDGKKLSDEKARLLIADLQSKGHDLISISDDMEFIISHNSTNNSD